MSEALDGGASLIRTRPATTTDLSGRDWSAVRPLET
jgi:hypothetical protein